MTVFVLDASTVSTFTDDLRADAASLTLLGNPPFPSGGPFAAFRAAVDEAVTCANRRAEEVRADARRVAAAMDLTVHAAAAVDGCMCEALEAVL